VPKGKRLIAIPEDIVRELMALASRSNVPFADFIESVLVQTLRALRGRSDIIRYFNELSAYVDLKRIGGIVIPYRVLYKLLDSVSEDVFREVIDDVRKLVEWFFSVERARGSGVGELPAILSLWIPDMRIEILETDNGKKLILSSPNQSERATELARVIVEASLQGLGIKHKNIECSRGLIVIDLG